MNNIKPREYNITLDTKRGHRVPLINITEGDTNSVVFHITLTEKGKKITVPNSSVVMLYFAKNDDTKTVQSTLDGSIFVVNGAITCEIKTNSIGVSKNTQVEVKVFDTKNNLLITPSKFEFNVLDTIVCNEDIESTNEYPLLIDLIDQVQSLESSIELTYGKSDIILLDNENKKKITPTVSVFSGGFGTGEFGTTPFGGTSLVLERCRVVYINKDTISIQPSDKFKDLKVDSTEKVERGEFVVHYKDSPVLLYIDIQQEV